MAYATDYTRPRHHHHHDDYDYQLSYRPSHDRHTEPHSRTLDIDRDIPLYRPDKHYLPNQDATTSSLELMGDYVSRRLVPTMLTRPDLPLQLVMNFGNLTLDSDPAMSSSSNAVIYNAPGSYLIMGPDSTTKRRRSFEEPGYIPGRKVGICRGCYKRQLVGRLELCWGCDGMTTAADTDISLGQGRGMKHVKSPDWLNARREEKEMDRLIEIEMEKDALRGRERERPYARLGYYGGDAGDMEDVRLRSRYGREQWS